ncbi:MAG: UDP-2,3-diacylglucosamine diphosphatase [Bacteroidales bacterium]|jgi:UDP-2,3-diacylglucosamine hydrolase
MDNTKDKCYFLSDFHLGIPSKEESLKREKTIITFLDSIKKDAKDIYILGDVFDFWFEYKHVVPKGFVRLLAKIAELVEEGVNVHLFKGNHDLWEFSYLTDELGVIYHRKPETIICNNKKVHLAHGDGLGPDDIFYKLLLKFFECKFCQFLYKLIHPDLGIKFGLLLSNKHRYTKRHNSGKDLNIKIENELLYKYTIKHMKKEPEIDYFIFGHRHIPILTDLPNNNSKFVLLGDWLLHNSYAVIDKEGNLSLHILQDTLITK